MSEVHTDAFGNTLSRGDMVAFCNTRWQGNTRMCLATVVGFTEQNVRVVPVGTERPKTILKVKVVKYVQ